MPDPEIPLAGGVGNAGAVVRVGATVRRPANRLSALVATHLEKVGFEAAPRYLGPDDEGRDVFTFIGGDVAVAPYPSWARRDELLREVGALLRDFHAAMRGFDAGSLWSLELADPVGGEVFCHNDVCPENVVFRDGRAIALLDFDLGAPGRPLWDLARTARMWVPMAVPGSSMSWPGRLDVWHRVGLLAEGFGAVDGDEFADLLVAATRQGQAWVRAKVEAGEPSFVTMWNDFGLADRQEADLTWLAHNKPAIAAATSAASA